MCRPRPVLGLELAVRPIPEVTIGVSAEEAAGDLAALAGVEMLEAVDVRLAADAGGGVGVVRPVAELGLLARDVEGAVAGTGEGAGEALFF